MNSNFRWERSSLLCLERGWLYRALPRTPSSSSLLENNMFSCSVIFQWCCSSSTLEEVALSEEIRLRALRSAGFSGRALLASAAEARWSEVLFRCFLSPPVLLPGIRLYIEKNPSKEIFTSSHLHHQERSPMSLLEYHTLKRRSWS